MTDLDPEQVRRLAGRSIPMRLALTSVMVVAWTLSAWAGVDHASVGGYVCGDLCGSWLALPQAPVDPGVAPRVGRLHGVTTSAAGRPRRLHLRAEAHGHVSTHASPAIAARHLPHVARLSSPTGVDPTPSPSVASPTQATTLRGGYPGAIPPDPDGHPDPAPIAAGKQPDEAGPAWEQAALRVFQGLNDPSGPVPGPSQERPGRRRRRRHD